MGIEEKTKYEVCTRRNLNPFWTKETTTSNEEYSFSELKNYLKIYFQNDRWKEEHVYKNFCGSKIYLFSSVPHPESEAAQKKIKVPDYIWVKIRKKN